MTDRHPNSSGKTLDGLQRHQEIYVWTQLRLKNSESVERNTWPRDPTFWQVEKNMVLQDTSPFCPKPIQGNHLATQLASSCRHPHFYVPQFYPIKTGHVQTPPAFSTQKICQLHPKPVGTATGRSKSSGSGLWRSKRHDLPNQRCATPTSGCCRDVLPGGRIG